jgi:hypothetical protein
MKRMTGIMAAVEGVPGTSRGCHQNASGPGGTVTRRPGAPDRMKHAGKVRTHV